ncbi:MAG: hypothetical protein BWY74_01762 [Firmicutes bacterium ADurb.Bin419]|nr:MAG: hypothetical protein BWY74_01762 [Firmicutes bacterium ADurb.Bin419]
MYSKVSKFILYVIFIFLLTVVIAGCARSARIQSDDITEQKSNEISEEKGQERTINEADINEAKSVIEKYFKALREGNYEEFRSTLGSYQDDYVQQDRVKNILSVPRQIELVEVSQPGKYLKDIPPQNYISYFNKSPYKTIIFHVIYNGNIDTSTSNNGNPNDYDFVLVKDDPDSEWKIHSWGV